MKSTHDIAARKVEGYNFLPKWNDKYYVKSPLKTSDSQALQSSVRWNDKNYVKLPRKQHKRQGKDVLEAMEGSQGLPGW